MKKKIAISAMSILTSLALLGGATFALFTDTATSQDNTFSTGSADLQIANDVASPGAYSNDIAGVSFTNIFPGFSEDTDFWLKNSSAGAFSMDVTVGLDDVTAGPELGDALMVSFQCDTDNDGIDGGDPVVGPKSVSTWESDLPEALAQIGENEGASDATNASDQDELLCRMNASVDSDEDNSIASQSVSFDGVFNGTQVAPAP